MKTIETIPLSHPVEVAPHPKAAALTMRRPKAADAARAERLGEGRPADVEIHLFAILTGQPYEVIAEVDYADDYPKLQAAYRNFRTARAVRSSGSAPGNSENAASASAVSE
ncbi:conserved hypothetical protein [uncultured Alphaproteobacteria bacterium]|uniref:Uncharacterized protein n=1 Tax=uncultured Alphaproteobacteria bacterium TaxID=91750 RepID=A0A212KBP9_9PROT|nr:conserved hypothetical protein [uncultured Alphaproteobacteria bacterium]